jgi:hypothetical protein
LARRNFARTLLSASLLLGSVVAGILAAPLPAGAAPPDFRPDHVVIVHETYFESAWGGQPGEPTKVYAHPNETVEFVLAAGVGPHHAVRLDMDCSRLLEGQCERAFDDPDAPKEHPVVWLFRDPVSVPFFDRYAREEHNFEMTGQFIIQNEELPPPVSPTTPTTVGPTTTTTARPATTTTTTAQTTTTTAPASIHPLLVSDPGPTTTTTAAAKPAPTNNAPVAAASSKDKDKGKNNDKGKAKAEGSDTPTTAQPDPAVVPNELIFDASTLTPGPTMLTDASNGDTSDEAAIDAAPIVGLLDHVEKAGDDGAHLMLLALGALTCLLLACGIWGWHNRSSRYDPA